MHGIDMVLLEIEIEMAMEMEMKKSYRGNEGEK
jgi:hypothetical protein